MKRKLAWTNRAWEDYLFWQETDKLIVKKINGLLEECRRNPMQGTGKPEILTGDLSGFFSRRINLEHRLVYNFDEETVTVHQCRLHY
jgi:toxin YoeB